MGSPPKSSSSTAAQADDMDNHDLSLQSSSTGGESGYGYQISSSPPTLSPSNTLPSLDAHTTATSSISPTASALSSAITSSSMNTSPSPTKDQHHHHSFPFLFSYSRSRSRSRSPKPPPPTEIPSPTGSTLNPLKHTQTLPNPSSRQSPPQHHSHQPHHPSSSSSSSQHQRRHVSESSVPTMLNTSTSPIPISPSSPNTTSPPTSSPSSPPTSPDTIRRDSWIQKKPRHTSGSLSPGGVGRHGDEWLFGGISFTQTARGLVGRRTSGGNGRGK